MKILLAHNHFEKLGGAEVFYHEVGRVLEKNGHEVAYFSPFDEDINSPWKEYFPQTVDYKSGGIINNLLSFKEMIYSKVSKNNMSKLLEDFKPDIVHVFAIHVRLTPSILDACKVAKVPVVMSCNDAKHICPNYKLFQNGSVCEKCKGGKYYNAIKYRCSKGSLKYSVASALEAYSHERTDIYRRNIHTFLFASKFMANKTEEFWGKESFRWDMLKNPFDSKKYKVSHETDDYILFFGRFVEEKGIQILIEAMSKIPEVKLKIIGAGPNENLLKKQAENLQNIEFLGPKWDDQLNDVLKKAYLVVVPSIWHENFPYVILQSFAFGIPVIGTNRGGIPELVIDGKHGYIYEANDPDSLAKKIKYIWTDQDERQKMSKTVKRYMDNNFNDDVFYNSIERIYNKVLK